MKKGLLSITFLLSILLVSAQEKLYSISGRVTSKENSIGISATITINSDIITANTTGNFTSKAKYKKGTYTLTISHIGFYTKTINWIVDESIKDCNIELEKSTTELPTLEVTSIRSNNKSPFAKTDISKADIEQNNQGLDIPLILNQTPSVIINSDAGNGVGYTYMRIRGTDASRINVTLNGIPYNDAESQGTFFVDLPDMASSLNSIQIQRGIGTSSNGTGAFGATINLSTNEINKEKYAETSNSFGSYNTFKNTVKFGTGLINNHFTVDARLSQIKSDGYIDRASSNLQSYALSAAYLNNNYSLRFNVFSGKEKTYQAWNGIDSSKLASDRTYNSAGTNKPGNPYNNETDNYTQKHYQLFFNHSLNSNWSYNIAGFYTKGFGYYENYKAGEKYVDYGITNTPIAQTDLIKQQWLDNNFYGSIFSVQYKNNNTQLTFGGSYTNYKGKHFGEIIWADKGNFEPNYKYYNLSASKFERSFYTKLQYSINKHFSLYGDVQYRFVEHDMPGFKYNKTLFVNRKFSFIAPKIGADYSFKKGRIYLSYAMASKEPNRDDFEAGATSQPKEETLHDFELGFEYKHENLFVSINNYLMLYKDQLVLSGKINDVGAYSRINVDNSYRLGTEIQATYNFCKWFNANANITLSKNKIKEFTEFADDYDNGGQVAIQHQNTDITLSPNVIFGNSLNFIFNKNISLNLIGKYIGKQYLDNTQIETRSLSSYYVQDAKLNITIPNKIFKETLLMISCNNILNKKYVANGYCYSYIYSGAFTTDKFYFPMATTNYLVSLKLAF